MNLHWPKDRETRLVLGVGAFLSALALMLGSIGLGVLGGRLADWFTIGDWPTTEATILASEAQSTSSRGGGRRWRATFRWSYVAAGETRTGQGNDLAEHYVGDRSVAAAQLAELPVGSTTRVFVDPDDPGRSFLRRGPSSGLVILLIPPLFLGLGIVGAIYTLAGAAGILDRRSQGVVARTHRAVGRWLLQAGVLGALVYGIFTAVILGLLAYGVLYRNVVVIALAGFVAYGLWVASRRRR